MKLIKKIYNFPSELYLSFYLEFGKFEKIELICNKRLKKDKKDFIALFFLMYGFGYRKEYEKARSVFYSMMEIMPLSKKTKKYFITDIINLGIKNKKYDYVKKDCNNLLENEKDFELRKILKRILCEVYYYEWDFDKLRKLCSELMEEYSGDSDIKYFTEEYLKAVIKENKNV